MTLLKEQENARCLALLTRAISAGTYVFTYTCAAEDDPDPATPENCVKYMQDVWGEIDRKSGEAHASGDPSQARSYGFYLGDCNLEHRGGRCKCYQSSDLEVLLTVIGDLSHVGNQLEEVDVDTRQV